MSHSDLVPRASLVKLLETQNYGVEYQPIVSLCDQNVFAYEALSRFFEPDGRQIRPDHVYAALHDYPSELFQVEFQQKQLQLQHAPINKPVFINLDQDSFFASKEQGEHNSFLQLFIANTQPEIIVELIENSEINDATMSLAMIDSLSKNGISTAIDDVCNPQSMISTSVIQLVNFIKLDKHVVAMREHADFLILVESLIDYAHKSGKQVILEGVETEQDLQFAKQLNVDFVQGFLYRDSFINISPTQP